MGGVVLPTELMDEIEHQLGRLFVKTGANCVLLIDTSGQLLSYNGSAEGVSLVNLAALVASDMAAVSEMARLIGERNRFKLLFHEGEEQHVLIAAVRGSFLLAIIFKTNIPIGLVRLFARETANQLFRLVDLYEDSRSQPANVVNADFAASLADELERTFKIE
jgi:predicted regulator of Ras-like GTPase activity (Roadblock/LC7/MglB family)